MLELTDVTAGYGDMIVIRGVSLHVDEGEIVCIIGANGAGKSTILRTISGLVKPTSGVIRYGGVRLDQLKAHEVPRYGIAHVPEGRRLFGRLTVLENLVIGAANLSNGLQLGNRLEKVFDLFPVLKDRRTQRAGTLSGGEQQMLAIGRAMMLNPSLLMLDEPSLGIAPIMVQKLMETIVEVNRKEGTTVLLVEQNCVDALRISSRAYVVQSGEVAFTGISSELVAADAVRKSYLGM